MKHVNKILAGLITCCVILLLSGCSPRQGEKHDFSIGKGTFLLDGKPFVIKAAEIHYTRIPAEYWQHRIQMCKALGMNTICIYAFWNIHEQKPGEFDFKGQNDIAAFCRLAQKEGMYIMLRPGPYVCSEWETALVVVEEGGYQAPYQRSLFPRTDEAVHERDRQAVG